MRFVTLALLQQDSDPFQLISDFLSSPFIRISGQLLLLLVVVLWVSLVYWTYTDARRRGTAAILWGIVAVIFPFLGTLVYLIVRPPEYELDARERELELAVLERELRSRVLLCPNCRALVEKDFLVCPACNWGLKKPCIECEKALDLNWSTCPYCGTDQETGKKMSW